MDVCCPLPISEAPVRQAGKQQVELRQVTASNMPNSIVDDPARWRNAAGRKASALSILFNPDSLPPQSLRRNQRRAEAAKWIEYPISWRRVAADDRFGQFKRETEEARTIIVNWLKR